MVCMFGRRNDRRTRVFAVAVFPEIAARFAAFVRSG